jgi:hypothetical protein
MSALGFVNAGIQLGLQSIAISPVNRKIYNIKNFKGQALADIVAQAVIEEKHTDTMEVTQHPVETGAPITDHAFVRPARLRLTLMWSNSPPGAQGLLSAGLGAATALSQGVNTVVGAVQAVSAAAAFTSNQQGAALNAVNAVYQQLLALMQQRALFSVVTGKRLYSNMICMGLSTESEWKTENNLVILVDCQEVFLVATTVTPLPANLQQDPSATASIVDNGTKSLIPGPSGIAEGLPSP